MEEIYKVITECPAYEVSNLGNVRNIKTKRVLKQHVDKDKGYCTVGLHTNRQLKTFKVHRFVAKHFIDNPYGYDQVDHINANRSDNCISNLRWVSGKDNMDNQLHQKNILYFSDILNKFVVLSPNRGNDTRMLFDNIEDAVTNFKSIFK